MGAGSQAGVDLAAGTGAGVAQLLVGHPFDTIKVKLQTMPRPAPGQPPMYAGPLDATRQVLAMHGPLGLYKGLGAPLATVAAFNAVLFTTWGALERHFRHADGSPLTTAESALAGGIAGVPVSFLAAPTELLKCRLQAQTGRKPPPGQLYSLHEIQAGKALFRGPMEVGRHVLAHEGGALGLFRGFLPTLMREVPGNAAYFGLYDWAKKRLAAAQGLSGPSELGAGSMMAAGGAGGAAYWLLTYPADVIKSKIQTDSYFTPKYRGVLDCARKVTAAEGWRGLWAGFTPCAIRSVPANAAAFTCFETIRALLLQE